MLDLGLLLAQLVVILLAARVAGRLVRPLGQPPVIGEMIAGLALGPSLLGALAPDALATLFPPDGLTPLATLSQLGVLLFMFVVGLRLDLDVLRGRARAAVAVSHASIVAPFVLGVGLAPLLHGRLAPAGVGFVPFALFLGAAMSVTAFPVLARILAERGLLGSRIGTVAIAAAAVDDVTAWCILAAVVAVARATSAGAGVDGAGGAATFAITMLTTGVYVTAVATIGRRWLAGVAARRARRSGAIDAAVIPRIVSLAVVAALASAWVTEYLGVHALFGAFLAGAVVPRATASERVAGSPGLADALADRIEGVVAAVLLPVFFAFTGLRTSVALIGGGGLWALFALILLAAVAGKIGGAASAARLTGMPWRDSLAVGALMNTRGLMELVILNVGLDIGVISPTLFAMMVLMAIITTIMTSPLLGWIYHSRTGSAAS
ncbi:MAG TPA: cation:proton antiporter [Gemmatimonadaceae bacterium]|jgi:Kef-type K+ transport system membrane component KefB|nr:cation:proton antiporter [Gemmatimonadaceae bacterium]